MGLGLTLTLIVGICAPFVIARRWFDIEIAEVISHISSDEPVKQTRYRNIQTTDGVYSIRSTQSGEGLYAREQAGQMSTDERTVPDPIRRKNLIQYGCEVPHRCSYCDPAARLND